MKQRQKPCWYPTRHESTHLFCREGHFHVCHKLCTESWPASASQSHLGRLHTAALSWAAPASRSSAGPSGLLCPPRVCVSLCMLHTTPSLHPLRSSLLKASPSPRFWASFNQAVLTPPLTHTHTLSPKEEIKSQMRGAWGGISQAREQELHVRLSSELSKLQLQWEYYACSSLKGYVFMWWPHMKSLMVTHGHQGSTRGCLVYQHNFMDFYCQKTGMRSTGREQNVYTKEKRSLSLPGAQAFHALALLCFLFISSWFHWSPTPTHSAREHLLSKKNLLKTPRNTASWLISFLRSFPERGGLVLI